jgi:D-alanyl-lipoteichoic acid acyltransferase DltB (MBOAT superfamily)
MENFNTPYFSLSVKEFWRRWHISLSAWFKDYLYIPLGGNRNGRIRKYLNFMIVFSVSGLWHGANSTFVVWGALHGLYQVIGDAASGIRQRIIEALKINTSCFSYKLGKMILTFLLICFAWIFFRSDDLARAFDFIRVLFSNFDPWFLFNEGLYELGLDRREFNILFLSISVLLLVDVLKRKKNVTIDAGLAEQNLWFRWIVILCLIFWVIIFGCYGPLFDVKQFIYFQF